MVSRLREDERVEGREGESGTVEEIVGKKERERRREGIKVERNEGGREGGGKEEREQGWEGMKEEGRERKEGGRRGR